MENSDLEIVITAIVVGLGLGVVYYAWKIWAELRRLNQLVRAVWKGEPYREAPDAWPEAPNRSLNATTPYVSQNKITGLRPTHPPPMPAVMSSEKESPVADRYLVVYEAAHGTESIWTTATTPYIAAQVVSQLVSEELTDHRLRVKPLSGDLWYTFTVSNEDGKAYSVSETSETHSGREGENE